jgi:hypothetical protein
MHSMMSHRRRKWDSVQAYLSLPVRRGFAPCTRTDIVAARFPWLEPPVNIVVGSEQAGPAISYHLTQSGSGYARSLSKFGKEAGAGFAVSAKQGE